MIQSQFVYRLSILGLSTLFLFACQSGKEEPIEGDLKSLAQALAPLALVGASPAQMGPGTMGGPQGLLIPPEPGGSDGFAGAGLPPQITMPKDHLEIPPGTLLTPEEMEALHPGEQTPALGTRVWSWSLRADGLNKNFSGVPNNPFGNIAYCRFSQGNWSSRLQLFFKNETVSELNFVYFESDYRGNGPRDFSSADTDLSVEVTMSNPGYETMVAGRLPVGSTCRIELDSISGTQCIGRYVCSALPDGSTLQGPSTTTFGMSGDFKALRF